jgi:hypothetical protein
MEGLGHVVWQGAVVTHRVCATLTAVPTIDGRFILFFFKKYYNIWGLDGGCAASLGGNRTFQLTGTTRGSLLGNDGSSSGSRLRTWF